MQLAIFTLVVLWCFCFVTNEENKSVAVQKQEDTDVNITGSNRIALGDYDLSNKDVPWHATLAIYGFIPSCGGSLISSRYVITAAHCVHANHVGDIVCPKEFRRYNFLDCAKDKELCPPGCYRVAPENIQVFLGSITKPNHNSKYLNVTNILLHPAWAESDDASNDGEDGHDIAILTLATRLVFTESIQQISLPNPTRDQSLLHEGTSLWVAGFGRTKNGTIPNILERAMVNVLPCTYRTTKSDGLVCALGVKGHLMHVADACKGDSGGGLYYQVGDRELLVGIVSFGDSCSTRKLVPGRYASLVMNDDNYNWIIEQLQR